MKRKTKRMILYVVAGLVVVGGINAIVKSCSKSDENPYMTSDSTSSQEKKKKEKEKVSYKIKPESLRINGPLNGVFEIVDKEYTFTDGQYMGYQVSIDFKRTGKAAPYNINSVDDLYCGGPYEAKQLAGVGIEILDENGTVMMKVEPDNSECLTLLRSMKDDVVSVTFNPYNSSLNGTPTSFRITSDVRPNKAEPVRASTSSSSASTDDAADVSSSSSSSSAIEDAKNKANEAIEAAKAVVDEANVDDAIKAGKAAYKLYKKMK